VSVNDLFARSGPQWKPSKLATRVAVRRTRAARSDHETRNKTQVRKRDGRCRFPCCVCRDWRVTPHVAHLTHKGAGGNPRRDRSAANRMIALCPPRHRESRISLDRGTLKIQPLTKAGTDGPCRWSVDVTALDLRSGKATWVVVGTEFARGVFEPFTAEQIAILDRIAALQA
jgi:hypothetical protein